MAAPGTDAVSLQRLAAARVAVQCLQSMQQQRVAAATPPPAAGRRAAAAAAPRDGGSRGGAAAAAAPAFALRRRRPPPLNAVDPGSSAARRAKWSAVARRQRGGGSSSAKSLDSLVMLERESAAGDDDGEDVPGFDGLAADASVDRRPGDGGGASVTARWFANSGKAHTYDVRAPPAGAPRHRPGFPRRAPRQLTPRLRAGCARGQGRRGGQAGAEAPRAAARNRAAGARPAADRPGAVADDVGANAARLRHRAAHQPGPSSVRTRGRRAAGAAPCAGGACASARRRRQHTRRNRNPAVPRSAPHARSPPPQRDCVSRQRAAVRAQHPRGQKLPRRCGAAPAALLPRNRRATCSFPAL